MDNYKKIVESLLEYSEEEWFEFKENWFEPHGIGEYISALSNAAALKGKTNAYFIWGINDKTHEITGTSINYQKDVKNEPFQHYLARSVSPDIGFTFHEIKINEKRVVVLDIPAAVKVPTSFDGIRYIRIGSSKESVAKYPEREAQLFDVLKNGLPSICNTESEYQELSFERLFTYYAGRGINLKEATFRKNLGLLTGDGKYNVMAQLLSDNCHMPIRVSIFRGESKSSPLFSIKEFGNTCILLALDKILEYGDVINLIQTDERGRRLQRKDVPLFDNDAFREALVNAFVHNKWVDGNAPMITVYSNRIEILSRGSLAPGQTRKGFYQGESIPVNQKLSDLFLQLHISERSGRGVPKITDVYGENAFEFRENSIVVSLPFNRIDYDVADNPVDNVVDKSNDLNETQQKILMEIRNNPNVTQPQLAILIGIGKTAVQNNIVVLKRKGFIERVGSNKSGYWEVLE
jgi:ATP-dependent DNA helicase RecG